MLGLHPVAELRERRGALAPISESLAYISNFPGSEARTGFRCQSLSAVYSAHFHDIVGVYFPRPAHLSLEGSAVWAFVSEGRYPSDSLQLI
jgi:hypothetical protein